MHKFVINGGRPLAGEVRINGAKNAILPALASCLLSEGECVFERVPLLEDVFVMCEVLRYYGVSVIWQGDTLTVRPQNIKNIEPPEQLMKKMRASNLILGPLLSSFGEVRLPFPGGCAIGSRPMNYHFRALSQLGAEIFDQGAFIHAKVEKLHGADICLDFPSVGATENAMMAAVKAQGRTIIYNAAREPEVVDLANVLIGMGAKIQGAGGDIIYIEGVEKLSGVHHKVVRDRIEAGTMMIAASITGGDILLEDYDGMEAAALIAKLKEAGVQIIPDARGLRVKACPRAGGVDIRTMPYPGFPTDMQPQFMALMATATGTSIIEESIFENRFRHAVEMRRMGADIKIIGEAAVIKGREAITGAVVEATDLRAGAALVLLGLRAEGQTIVENTAHIDRGYQCLEKTLRSLGADIYRSHMSEKTVSLPELQLCTC